MNAPTAAPEPVLSIVIVNWNTQELLAACLTSVARAASGLPFETIVVDNGSTDGSQARLRRDFPWVRLIANPDNRGFAAATNQGIRASTGRWVLLLNSDTVVQPGALDALVHFLDARPQAGAAGARLLNGDGSLQPSAHPMLTPGREFWSLLFLERLWPRARYRQERWDCATPRRVEALKGACLLLRRAALDQVGLLDERYFLYTEEVDLCRRLSQAAWELWYVPQAAVMHYGAASSRQTAEAMYVQLYRSKLQFYRKFGGAGCARRARLLYAAAYAPRALAATAAGVVKPSLRPQARCFRRLLAALPSL